MKNNDAASILNITGDITPAIVKKAYHLAAKKYHPDINPAGAEMMKMVNDAFDALKDFTGQIEDDTSETCYPEAVNEALNAIVTLEGLEIEVCGAWVWVTGNTRDHKDALKAAGYRYASKKKAWYYRPTGWKSKGRGNWNMNKIRDTHGSQGVKSRKPTYISAQAA